MPNDVTKENKAVVLNRLKQVYGVLASPKRWTKGTAIRYLPDGGTAYCMTGATQKVDPVLAPVLNKQLLAAINTHTRKFSSVVAFNDYGPRTHKRVLATIKEAIKLTENTKV